MSKNEHPPDFASVSFRLEEDDDAPTTATHASKNGLARFSLRASTSGSLLRPSDQGASNSQNSMMPRTILLADPDVQDVLSPSSDVDGCTSDPFSYIARPVDDVEFDCATPPRLLNRVQRLRMNPSESLEELTYAADEYGSPCSSPPNERTTQSTEAPRFFDANSTEQLRGYTHQLQLPRADKVLKVDNSLPDFGLPLNEPQSPTVASPASPLAMGGAGDFAQPCDFH